MQNMVKLKQISLLLIIILTISSCSDVILNWTPITFYEVICTPETVKIGDEITISYMYHDPSKIFDYNKVSLDEDGNIVDENRSIDEPVVSNKFVSFGNDVSTDCTSTHKYNGYTVTEYQKFTLSKIYANKYTEFKNNQVKCIVPKNAKSGYVYLQMCGCDQNHGFSKNKLTVLDASGDIIK